MAAPVEDRCTAVVFDKKLESHFSEWNKDFTERPRRVIETLHRCEQLKLLERCLRIPVREATEAEIESCHTKAHLELLESTATMSDSELKAISQRYDYIYFHPKSAENAKLALGGIVDLVDAIVTEKVRNGMAITRPPGHHAMREEFCGYCYLANTAIAAQLMLEKYDMKRILILDWDVHHGQGTQYEFYDDPRVLFVSIHRYEQGREWPNLREGDYDFTGEGPGKGFNINLPLNEIGCDNSDYLAAMFNLLLPIFYQFDPELILVSAGYDCAIGCPEGEMSVTPACFAHFVNLLKPLAKGKLAVILEGGYNMKSLAESSALTLRALLGDPTPAITPITAPKHSVTESILNCIKVLHHYWPCLQYQDFVEAHKVKAESYPYEGVLHLPPVKDVEFYTSHNRPEVFPLIQDCADGLTLQRQAEMNRIIDELIQSTSLLVPQARLSSVCLSDNSSIQNYLKTRELWSSCQSLQDVLSPSRSASDCIRVSMGSILSNEVQCSLCCLQSPSQHTPLNGTPVNGNANSEPNLVNTVVYHALESHSLHRVLVIDLSPELHPENSIKDSPSVLYVAVRLSDQEAEEPSVWPHTVDISLTQESLSSADLISLFFQVVLPLAYEFCPELVVLKMVDVDISKQHVAKAYRSCVGHLTQLLLGLAGGKLLILAREPGQTEQPAASKASLSSSSESSSSSSSTQGSGASTGEGGETVKHPTESKKGKSHGEGGGEGVTVLELLEECVRVILGDPCSPLKVNPPSHGTVTTIKKAQDKLKTAWSVFQFRVQLPIISI